MVVPTVPNIGRRHHVAFIKTGTPPGFQAWITFMAYLVSCFASTEWYFKIPGADFPLDFVVPFGVGKI